MKPTALLPLRPTSLCRLLSYFTSSLRGKLPGPSLATLTTTLTTQLDGGGVLALVGIEGRFVASGLLYDGSGQFVQVSRVA